MDSEVIKYSFALAQSKDTVLTDIIKILPNVKLDWIYHKKDEMFETSTDRIKIFVKEKSIEFHVVRKNSIERKIYVRERKVGKNVVSEKMNLYIQLLQRFAEYDDFKFYKKVLGNLNGQIEKQKQVGILTFTEDGRVQFTEETEDS